MEPLRYEGRLGVYDVEPGAVGDVIQLLDQLRDDGFPETLDAVFERWSNAPLLGEVPGRFRITIERLDQPALWDRYEPAPAPSKERE